VTSILDAHFDHKFLNETLPNPTAELIAAALFSRIEDAGIPLDQLRLWETPDASAIVQRQ